MAVPLSQMTIPVLLRGLDNLSHVLDKAEAHCALTRTEADQLVRARLAPDMFPLSRQVQAAADAAKACVGRLSGQQIPSFADTEVSFDELHARIAKTVDFIHTIAPGKIDTGDEDEITLPLPSGNVIMTKKNYTFKLALPNFYFHLATAYAVLRHQGVNLGKSDYLGDLSA